MELAESMVNSLARKRKRVTQLFFLAGMALASQHVEAQTTASEWWPEVDVFVKINGEARLEFVAARATDGATYNSAELGPTLEITLKPILQTKQDSLDDAKRKYLTFGVGYRYYSNLDKPNENRAELDLTPRYFLPGSLLLSDRNRIDLRVIGDNFSWRYRNRLTLERAFRFACVQLTPYARGEVYYDNRYGIWNMNRYSFGVIIPVRKRAELEPYYEHINDSRSSVKHVNAFGFATHLYF
jgi:hypothetical protein